MCQCAPASSALCPPHHNCTSAHHLLPTTTQVSGHTDGATRIFNRFSQEEARVLRSGLPTLVTKLRHWRDTFFVEHARDLWNARHDGKRSVTALNRGSSIFKVFAVASSYVVDYIAPSVIQIPPRIQEERQGVLGQARSKAVRIHPSRRVGC